MTSISIIKTPIISEKANNLTDTRNTYCFYVEPKANKFQIRAAIENLYDVRVEDLNVMVGFERKKSRVSKQGKKIKYKKAYVRLREGQKIEFFKDL